MYISGYIWIACLKCGHWQQIAQKYSFFNSSYTYISIMCVLFVVRYVYTIKIYMLVYSIKYWNIAKMVIWKKKYGKVTTYYLKKNLGDPHFLCFIFDRYRGKNQHEKIMQVWVFFFVGQTAPIQTAPFSCFFFIAGQ